MSKENLQKLVQADRIIRILTAGSDGNFDATIDLTPSEVRIGVTAIKAKNEKVKVNSGKYQIDPELFNQLLLDLLP